MKFHVAVSHSGSILSSEPSEVRSIGLERGFFYEMTRQRPRSDSSDTESERILPGSENFPRCSKDSHLPARFFDRAKTRQIRHEQSWPYGRTRPFVSKTKKTHRSRKKRSETARRRGTLADLKRSRPLASAPPETTQAVTVSGLPIRQLLRRPPSVWFVRLFCFKKRTNPVRNRRNQPLLDLANRVKAIIATKLHR